MRSARLAWSFLTRLPGGRHPADGESMAGAAPWFPAVGALLGSMLGLVHLGLLELVSAPLAALLVVGLGAMATGAFHEDGLADTFDAFGGYTRERRLEIMRDSRIGTFGTLALVVATGLKVGALSGLDGSDALLVLVLAHSFGRAGALAVMAAGPEARTDGLAARAADLPVVAVRLVLAATLVVGLALGPVGTVAVGGIAVVAGSARWAALRRFGGTTGDVLGAIEQAGEIVVLVVGVELLAQAGWTWA